MEDQTIAKDEVVESTTIVEDEPTSSPESQAETETSSEETVTPQKEEDVVEDKPTPFHKDPAFKERVQEIETKYGKAAQNWEIVNQLATEDPEFALIMIEKMEKAGKVPQGTYEKAKLELKPEPKEEKKQDTKEVVGVEDVLKNNPDIEYARQLRERDLQRQQEEAAKAEKFLQDFEAKRPKIAESSDPLLTRQSIAMETKRIMKENKDISFETAMDIAYKWVVERESVLEEYKEKGEIEGLARRVQEDSVTSTGGSASPSKRLRALSPEEVNARDLMGLSTEEYLKYLDDPNSSVVE